MADMANTDFLRTTMKRQSTQVTEMTLGSQADHGCFLRTSCAIGTLEDKEMPEFSMAMGMYKFKELLEKMLEDSGDESAEYFPHIRKTLARFVKSTV